MKRIFCLLLIIIMVFTLSACASKNPGSSETPATVEDNKGVPEINWKPVTVYDDFGEKVGYSNQAIEYDTKCAFVGEENNRKLSVEFTYVQNPDLQGFNIAIEADHSRGTFGYGIRDLLYKIDGETYEIIKLYGVGLWAEEHKEDVERIYSALIEGKDVAFSVEIKYHSSAYQRYAFTVSGYGFADVVSEYLE